MQLYDHVGSMQALDRCITCLEGSIARHSHTQSISIRYAPACNQTSAVLEPPPTAQDQPPLCSHEHLNPPHPHTNLSTPYNRCCCTVMLWHRVVTTTMMMMHSRKDQACHAHAVIECRPPLTPAHL